MANTSARSSTGSKAQKPALAAMSTTARARLISTRQRKNGSAELLTTAPMKAAANSRVLALTSVWLRKVSTRWPPYRLSSEAMISAPPISRPIWLIGSWKLSARYTTR